MNKSIALTVALVVVAVSVGCSSPTTTSPPTSSLSTTTSPATAAPNCAQDDLATTVAYTSIAGVDANLTSLDIYPLSDECNAPVVMWVHGGGYSIGDKSKQIDSKVRLFNDAGWILVSVNYRLSIPGSNRSARFPDHYDDVATAVAWIHDNIADYGGDPMRIALLGHSAGADIVSNLVTNPAYLQRVGLALDAITCAGPLDTEGFDKAQAGSNDPDGELAQWSNALGNNPEYISETSATLLIEPGIGIPPMIGVVRGTPRRQNIESEFLSALSAAGIASVSIDARSLTHNEVNTRIGAANDRVMTPPLMQFLTNCLT